MVLRTEVEALAEGIEGRLRGCNAIGETEAQLCAAGLRMLADNERLCEVASTIEQAVGLPWHDARVMRAASRIKLMFDADFRV